MGLMDDPLATAAAEPAKLNSATTPPGPTRVMVRVLAAPCEVL